MLMRMRFFERWMVVLVLMNGLALVGLGAAEFRVDKARSKVTVGVKATGDDFTALLEDYRADILVDDTTHQPTNAVFSWDFKDLKTGKDKRDKAMLEWMEAPRLSRATFTFQGFERKGETNYALGVMELHGIKKSMSFPVVVEREGEQMSIRGRAKLDHQDYGLKIIRMLLLFKVDPNVEIGFELKGKLVK